MSFRSRSRTVQPIVTRRASSLTRTIAPPSVNGSSTLGSSYAGRSYTGASAIGSGSYGTSNSPLASGYSSSPYGGTSSPSSRSLLGSAGGAGGGSTNGSGHYFDYTNLSRRDSYGGSSSSLAYKSPYKDKDRYGGGSSYTPSAGSTSSSSYKDRYVSPYTSYDNGITTASLSLSGLKRHHHLSSNGLSTSNTSLNGYVPSATSGSSGYHHHHHTPTTGVGRSQSLRDHERRSRSRTRASQAASSAAALASYPSNSSLARSYSTTSVQSEGYETGSERGRSRVGSTASELDTASSQQQQQQDSSRENGGDFIDYKALYEQEKADNEKLKMALRKKDEEVVTLKAALDRFTTATTKNNSLSELEKRERRAMERKMSEMEEELKLLQKYKTENERLRAENRALTRVVSKLTTSAQNQIHSNAAKQ
uniref:cGMP-dependent protein kinase interacting domain-containing protein n=1 Tax=Anopheles atroparvus TaxID=41427 RepID=A0AAG5DG71_ANOAO